MEKEYIDSIWKLTTEKQWFSISQIAELLLVSPALINTQLKKLFKSGTLCEYDVCKYSRLENGNQLDTYNMETVLTLAFHINSPGSCHFRKELLLQLSKKDSPIKSDIILCVPGKYSC